MMKVKLLVLFMLISYAVCTIGTTNSEDAETPEDVAAFRAMHADEAWVLFFHDSSDKKQTGFFQSIFGIFGSQTDLDEEYQNLIAKKYPTLEIDTNIEALKNVPEAYEVPTMPFVIAYYKNVEMWREMPSKETADLIENLLKEKVKNKIIVYPQEHTSIKNNKTEDEFIRRIEKERMIRPHYYDYAAPYEVSRPYPTEVVRSFEPEYGHLYRGEEYVRPGQRVVYNVPQPSVAQYVEPPTRDNTRSGNYVTTQTVRSSSTGTSGGVVRNNLQNQSSSSSRIENTQTNRIVNPFSLTQDGRGAGAQTQDGRASYTQTQSGRSNNAQTQSRSGSNAQTQTFEMQKPQSSGPSQVASDQIVVRKYDEDRRP